MVEKYLGESASKRLILSHNKHLNVGEYLIDHRTANGAGQFSGMHIHFRVENSQIEKVFWFILSENLNLEEIVQPNTKFTKNILFDLMHYFLNHVGSSI